MFSQIGNCIKLLKDNNVIHNNIKPSNIMFNEDRSIILIDGCKYLLYENNINIPLQSIKSYHFYSPEQLNNKRITYQSDIWSFGCVIYYIYTGNSPFNDNTIGELYSHMLTNKYYPLIAKNTTSIENILEKIFINDPKKRMKIEDILLELDNIDRNSYFSDDNIMILPEKPSILLSLL